MHEECKYYFERISEYLDGELDSETCKKIKAHLEDCPECHNCFDSLKKTIDLCKNLPDEKIPEEIRQRLRTSLKIGVSP